MTTTTPHSIFESRLKKHGPSQAGWAKYAKYMLCHDVDALRTTPYAEHLRKLSARKAIHAYLHFSNSFQDLKYIRQVFGVPALFVFDALLNGRNVILKSKRPPHILAQLEESDVEPIAFAWLVWAAPHFQFLPWSFLKLAFDNIPRIEKDKFGDSGIKNAFDERCQKLVYSKNRCIAAYALLDGRKVDTSLAREDYSELMADAVAQNDHDWVSALTLHMKKI